MKCALLAIFLTFRFMVELALFAAFAYWASLLPFASYNRLVLGAAAVIAAAVVWGTFVSPKARVRLPENGRLTVELCIVLAAVLALRGVGRPQLALGLGAIAVVVAVVNSLLRRETRAPTEDPT